MKVTLPRYEDVIEVVARVRRLFDLDADPFAIGTGSVTARRCSA